MDRDVKAFILILECQEAVRYLKTRFPKMKSINKWRDYLDRMNICYFNAQCYDDVIVMGEWVLKLYDRFMKFWIFGERRFNYIKNKSRKKQ